MFEREAEEYINKNKIELSKILDSIGIDFVLSSRGQKLKNIFERIWKDGAEFGYNLAKKEIDKPVDIDDIIAWKEIVLPKESE